MDAEKFIDVIRLVVVDGSIKGIESTLNDPPGRKPAQNLIEMAQWFNNCSDKDKEIVLKIIRESIETSIFGLLCVLDGVMAIEDDHVKGHLELYYKKGETQQLLNDPEGEYLHDLFNA